MPDRVDRRDLRSPITTSDLRPAEASLGHLTLRLPLTVEELDQVGAWLRDHAGFGVRLRNPRHGDALDLQLLEHLPVIRRLSIDSHVVTSFDGLRHTPDLEGLLIGDMGSVLDLAPIGGLELLRRLYVRGLHRGIEVLSELRSLEDLTLRATALTDLGLLRPLTALRVLDLQYGRIRDLEPLLDLDSLEHLEVQRLAKLTDLTPLARIQGLRRLQLAHLPQVGELPDLSGAHALEELRLVGRVGQDLAPFARAPNLRRLWIAEAKHLAPHDLAPFAGHDRLEAASIAVGARQRSAEAARLLGLPAAPAWDERPFGA